MKSTLTILISFLFIVSGFSQTRNVVVGTNDVIVQPTNFWSANASNALSGLGLGTAATNPASAFQPSSFVLSNLASSNGSLLTNIPVASVVGALATNGSAAGLTNFPASVLSTNGNAIGLTNFPANLLRTNGSALGLTGFPAEVYALSNATGVLAIEKGGTGATNAGGARTNFGLGWFALTNSNAATSLLGVNTNGQVVANTGTNVLTITNDTVVFQEGIVANKVKAPSGDIVSIDSWDNNSKIVLDGNQISVYTDILGIHTPITFAGTNASLNTATTRTNLGLGWSALTNSNTGTGLVSVNTNGEVVSPTNFWQVAPIQTLVQDFTSITVSQTNNATNARNVYIYSLSTNVSGISNTIILPTNTLTFNGDEVCVVHRGTTNITTVIRQAGSTNNLITLNRFDESVKFIRELGQWDFYHNISYVEPIQFSGTNAAANAAASRTNLGLGWPALTNTNAATSLLGFTTNGQVVANTGTNVLTFSAPINLYANDSTVSFVVADENLTTGYDGKIGSLGFGNANLWLKYGTNQVDWGQLVYLDASGYSGLRTNLGLGWSALTNTNAAGFQRAIFSTNAAPTNSANINTVNFNTAVAWIEISVVTNSVTNSYRIPVFQ